MPVLFNEGAVGEAGRGGVMDRRGLERLGKVQRALSFGIACD